VICTLSLLNCDVNIHNYIKRLQNSIMEMCKSQHPRMTLQESKHIVEHKLINCSCADSRIYIITYSKTHFTKANCMPDVTKGPGKAVSGIGTCQDVATKNFMAVIEHNSQFQEEC
jgi:hypothetical protein